MIADFANQIAQLYNAKKPIFWGTLNSDRVISESRKNRVRSLLHQSNAEIAGKTLSNFKTKGI